MYRRWPLAALAAALTLSTAPAAFGDGGDPSATAGWHGREIRDPLPQRVRDAVARFSRGWSAGSVGLGSGYASPGGSRRVREVQRRLQRRGYRPGRVDGRFGPRTRAALTWFQLKHGLSRTGRADARSLALLRGPVQVRTVPATPRSPVQPAGGTSPAAAPRTSDFPWLLLPVAMLLAALAAFAWRGLRGRPAEVEAGSGVVRRAPLTAAPEPPAHAPTSVIGYATVAPGADSVPALDSAARDIGAWCERREWHLTQLVHDREPVSRRIADRPGLAYALDEIVAGRIVGLVLIHLSDLTSSVTELARLLQWLNEQGAFVIALDYNLDTSTAAGELAAGALMEVGDWERTLIANRTRPGLTAIRTQAAANRTSVRDNPQLSQRIRTMRAQGMSLQAISDRLNAEGVPTLRGGTHWRPSSVQAATGYKRPPANLAGGRDLPPRWRASGANARWDDPA